MTLVDYLKVLRRRWLAIVVCAAIGLIVADVAAITSPKTYQARSESFVTISTNPKDNTGSSIYSGSQFALSQVQSYTQLVSSPLVLEPVIKQLDLDLSLAELRGKVTAVSPQDSVLVQVTAKAGDPSLAARIANTTATQLGKVIEQVASPVSAGQPLVEVTLTQPAISPDAPSSPRLKLYLALGLLIGLAAGVTYAVIRQQLDTSISSPDDLQAMTAAPPVGTIDVIKTAGRRPPIISDELSQYAEGFRAIRTNLQFVDLDRPPRAIVVTSPMPGEGKSITACNLAIAMAQSGSRVCLISADLRQPTVAKHLGITQDIGLTDVLTGRHDLDDALVPWRGGLLSVLVAGTLPSDPSAVLASQAMAATMQALRDRFDAVIIDAPALQVTDAAIVANLADGAVLIARHGHTTRDQLRRAVDALRAADARLLGTVLTFMPAKRHRFRFPARDSVAADVRTRQATRGSRLTDTEQDRRT